MNAAGIALLLLVAAGPQELPPDLPPDLPAQIAVPTPTEAIGIDQLYAVRAGKLWTRRGADPWQLYDGTGTAPGSAQPLIAVIADERDHFTVVSDDGRLHHHENGAWDSLWGLPQAGPFRGPLALPFGIAALRAGRMAYSMRRDHVVYYQDARGQQFNWGTVGTTTLYLLTEDGTRILLADPWIPPDYAREVCTPRRDGGSSAVRLASVASSASTLMAIAVDGAVSTLFWDYDVLGGTPFYRYAYGAFDPQPLPGTDPASELQTRALPPEGWISHARVPLTGQARLSRLIAVVQVGAGNTARMLRIAGDDDSGTRGVWEKALDAPAWSFRMMDVAIRDDAWLDPHAVATLPAPALAMAGTLRHNARLGRVSVRTDDFWFHCSPFSLTLTVDQEDVPLLVHTVDAWTLFSQDNPVDSEGYLPMKATVTLAPGADERMSPRARARLAELFGSPPQADLGFPFAFAAVANRHELVLAPVGHPWNVGRSRFELVLRADPRLRARRVAPTHLASTRAAQVVDLSRADDFTACASDPDLRARAAEALQAVRADARERARRAAIASTLEALVPAPLVPLDALSVVTSTRWTLPLFGWVIGLELHTPSVLAAQQMAWQRTNESAQSDLSRVERSLFRCSHAD